MDIVAGVVIFLVSWWMVLFTLLPVGVRSQEEEGDEIEPGTERGAPVKPMLLKKMIGATIGATIITLIFHLAIEQRWIQLTQ